MTAVDQEVPSSPSRGAIQIFGLRPHHPSWRTDQEIVGHRVGGEDLRRGHSYIYEAILWDGTGNGWYMSEFGGGADVR